MKLKNTQINYDTFHKTTSIQKKIISNNNFTYKQILTTISKHLKSSKCVLDIGCGAGTIALYVASKGNIVTGIDTSKHAVTEANRSAKYLKLKNATFKQMHFPQEAPSEKYDFIICSEVIEHIEDDDLALKKMYSLLKKGGIVFLSTPSINAPLHKLGMAREFDKRVGHLRRYTLEEISEKAKIHGFTILETKKTEGIVRNFLFLNPVAGKSVRFIKYFITDIVTFIDYVSLKLFGESNLYVILQKPITLPKK